MDPLVTLPQLEPLHSRRGLDPHLWVGEKEQLLTVGKCLFSFYLRPVVSMDSLTVTYLSKSTQVMREISSLSKWTISYLNLQLIQLPSRERVYSSRPRHPCHWMAYKCLQYELAYYSKMWQCRMVQLYCSDLSLLSHTLGILLVSFTSRELRGRVQSSCRMMHFHLAYCTVLYCTGLSNSDMFVAVVNFPQNYILYLLCVWVASS